MDSLVAPRDPGVPSSSQALDSGRIPITGEEFGKFQQLVLRQSGIHLTPVKRGLVVARLGGRLRDLGLSSFAAYYRRVRRDPEELAEMLARISTQETRFFREPEQFAFLSERAFPGWEAEARSGRRQRRLRAWSAGCSTGEEPFSLAMCALVHLPGWSVDVLATDLSHRAVAQAREAMWPLERAEQIPRRHRKRFMLRGVRSRGGWIKAGPELRAVVRFEQMNLHRELPAGTGRFDVILCRNVLIYFHPAARSQALRDLLGRLVPGGYLLLGHAESPSELWGLVRRVAPTVYTPIAGGDGR